MFLTYLAAEIAVLLVASALVINFLRVFGIRKNYTVIMMFPLFIFTLGFSLRLSGIREIVDLGFFFTDFTFVFIYIMFTASFMLGQIKYWKKQ